MDSAKDEYIEDDLIKCLEGTRIVILCTTLPFL